MNEKAGFLKSLSVLATACRYQLTEETIRIYDLALGQLGYIHAERAVVHAFMIRKSNDPMPSIMDLVRFAQGRNSDESMASELSDKCWEAVALFGRYQEKQAKEHVGDTGAKVIERTGWNTLCELDASHGPTIRAQMRQTAKAILESQRFQVINQLLGGPDEPKRIRAEEGHHDLPPGYAKNILPSFADCGVQGKIEPK